MRKLTKTQIENLEFKVQDLTISASKVSGNTEIFITLPNDDVMELGQFYSLMQRKMDKDGSIPAHLTELYVTLQREWKSIAN